MDFDLPSELKEFRNTVSDFARAKLAPGALERAHSTEYPWGAAQEIAAQGLLGLTISEDRGGQGAGLLAAIVAIQAIAAHCPRSADVVQSGNFGPLRTFAEYASPAQREKYLDGFLSGKEIISLGMSEPEAGSSVTELSTKATADGDGFRLSGTKVFSTHSTEASAYLVYCRFGPGVDGIGSVIVDRGTPGLTVGQPSEFMNGELWNQLYFDDCRINPEQVLLGPGGFKRQLGGFNVERLGNAARSLAVGRYALDTAIEHVKQRKQFGRVLAEFQGLQWMIADAAVALESAQLLLFRAAVAGDRDGLPGAQDTAMAKLAANEAGFRAADVAVQSMGATGFSRESLVEYCFRRTRGWRIAGGSVEILRNRVAEGVFDRRFDQRSAS